MYNVSDAYKLAVADSHRKTKMRAVLTIDKTVINLDDSDIIKDSVYITNQCTNGNEYEYGCVYSAECGITIKSAIDRYSLYDAELRLYWSLLVGEDTWEEIPLGVFYISEPNRINDKINIKALDGMTKLDVNVSEDIQGTMPELISWICVKCGVEMAQTSEELSKSLNGNIQYSVYEDKVETYRDLLAYVCMLSCSFATFDRDGKLKIVSYASEPCITLHKNHRFANPTFSDYKTSFAGVKIRFIAKENYAPYEAGETENGLVLDMGDNPIVRGLPETKHKILDAIYYTLKNVNYTPCEIETLGNPALELGDYIENMNVGKDNKTYYSPITYYNWTYRGKHKLRAVGGNPKLANVKSRQDRHMSSLEGEIEAKNIQIKSYVNVDNISFTSDEVEIASLNYAATEESKLIFLMTVRLELSLDGLIVIKFYNDAKLDEERIFKKYLERGEHFITISELYTADTNDRRTISITAHMEYFESDTRKQDADIITSKNFLEALKNTGATVSDNVVAFPSYEAGVIDETVASAKILKGGVKAILYGQGISGESKWDGTINFAENINKIVKFTGGLSFIKEATEKILVKQQTPVSNNFSLPLNTTIEFKSNFGFDTNIISYANIGEVIKDYTFNTGKALLYTFDRYVSTNNDMFALQTIYNYESVEEEIDSGKMSCVAIDYTGINVESVVVNNG